MRNQGNRIMVKAMFYSKWTNRILYLYLITKHASQSNSALTITASKWKKLTFVLEFEKKKKWSKTVKLSEIFTQSSSIWRIMPLFYVKIKGVTEHAAKGIPRNTSEVMQSAIRYTMKWSYKRTLGRNWTFFKSFITDWQNTIKRLSCQIKDIKLKNVEKSEQIFFLK